MDERNILNFLKNYKKNACRRLVHLSNVEWRIRQFEHEYIVKSSKN